MRVPVKALCVLLLLLLQGCATFSPYSLSEANLESYFSDQVKRFDREQLQNGSPLSVRLNDADIQIGPEGRDTVQLGVDGEVALNAFLARIPVGVQLKVEGTPVYEPDEKAIYIRRLKLLDSKIQSDYINQDLKPVTDSVMRAVSQLLETMPVYRLNESDFSTQIIGMIRPEIRIEPGRLVLVPASDQ
ncbi:DUF1439 domain-containing protein [Marinobacteraceae bacterium S3BR75-40.1]